MLFFKLIIFFIELLVLLFVHRNLNGFFDDNWSINDFFKVYRNFSDYFILISFKSTCFQSMRTVIIRLKAIQLDGSNTWYFRGFIGEVFSLILLSDLNGSLGVYIWSGVGWCVKSNLSLCIEFSFNFGSVFWFFWKLGRICNCIILWFHY